MLEEAKAEIEGLLTLMKNYPTRSQWLQGYEAGKLANLQWVVGRLEDTDE